MQQVINLRSAGEERIKLSLEFEGGELTKMTARDLTDREYDVCLHIRPKGNEVLDGPALIELGVQGAAEADVADPSESGWCCCPDPAGRPLQCEWRNGQCQTCDPP